MALSSIFKITGLIIWNSYPGFKMCAILPNCSYSFHSRLYSLHFIGVLLLADWSPQLQHSVFFVAFGWLFGWVNEPFSSKAAQCPVFLTKICLNVTSSCKDRVWEFQSLFFTVTLLCKCVYGAIKGKEIDSKSSCCHCLWQICQSWLTDKPPDVTRISVLFRYWQIIFNHYLNY